MQRNIATTPNNPSTSAKSPASEYKLQIVFFSVVLIALTLTFCLFQFFQVSTGTLVEGISVVQRAKSYKECLFPTSSFAFDQQDSYRILNENIKLLNNHPLEFKAKLHILTYANEYRSTVCDTLISAGANGNQITLLGMGVPWRGYRDKIAAVIEYIALLPPHDVVLFHDGFDVQFQQNSTYILKEFFKMNTSIVYSAEKNCWPNLRPGYCLGFPESPLPRDLYGPDTKYQDDGHELNIPHFLNSGALIGLSQAVLELYKSQYLTVQCLEDNRLPVDDQEIASDHFRNPEWGIQLDYWSVIFQSMHLSGNDNQLISSNDPLQSDKLVWKIKATNVVPALMHFNGGGKEYMEKMARKMDWRFFVDFSKLPKILVSHVINGEIDQKSVDYSSVCVSRWSDLRSNFDYSSVCVSRWSDLRSFVWFGLGFTLGLGFLFIYRSYYLDCKKLSFNA